MKLLRSARWAAIALAALAAVPCYAQEDAARNFPNKPIRIVVGYAAGGGNDIIVRLLSGKLSEGLGQPVLVENKPGAQSIIAAEHVAKAAPDGYTLLMGPTGPMAINPAIYAKLPYSVVRDFVPISMIGRFPLILVTDPKLPINTVKELIDYAKAKPAQAFYSAASASFQLPSELFNQITGTRFVHVPYKSATEMLTAVISGQVTMTIADLPAVAGALRSGTVRGLAIMTEKRHPGFPNLRTIVEEGLPEVQITIWTGFFAPAATPAAIVKRLQDEVARVVRLPDMREGLDKLGIEPSGNTSEEFGRIVASDTARWTAVAKAGNIKAD
jgi:tripartite-type tricarboxylate transporter receptor subunit TctC